MHSRRDAYGGRQTARELRLGLNAASGRVPPPPQAQQGHDAAPQFADAEQQAARLDERSQLLQRVHEAADGVRPERGQERDELPAEDNEQPDDYHAEEVHEELELERGVGNSRTATAASIVVARMQQAIPLASALSKHGDDHADAARARDRHVRECEDIECDACV